MRLYSYVVARDFGFAPNPFNGVCTLATCKPNIRKAASVGDWILGTGSSSNSLSGRLVYIMQVSEKLTYDDYWNNEKFNVKKPNLKGSLKQAFGDNIYHHNLQTGEWMQEPSHHSLPNGNQNLLNVDHDTQTEFILVGERFTYWGGNGPSIPNHFRNYNGIDICALRNHKCNFSVAFVNEFLAWINSLNVSGYLYPPKQFRKKP